MNTLEKIAFCFALPQVDPAAHLQSGLASVLYLLRREVLLVAGYDANRESEAEAVVGGVRERLFASMILIFTGFDLLAKYQNGDARFGGVGGRFVRFLTSPDGANLPVTEAELCYAVRNSLVHAFGIPVGQRIKKKLGVRGVALDQRAEQDPTLVSKAHRNGGVILYIDGLFGAWQSSIGRFQASLVDPDPVADSRRIIFRLMFDKYGTIGVRF